MRVNYICYPSFSFLFRIACFFVRIINAVIITALIELCYFKSNMMKFLSFLDMEDATNSAPTNENPSSSLTCICANEISIRNHPYIISLYINRAEQPQIDITIE
jgi:hypothetical protein